MFRVPQGAIYRLMCFLLKLKKKKHKSFIWFFFNKNSLEICRGLILLVLVLLLNKYSQNAERQKSEVQNKQTAFFHDKKKNPKLHFEFHQFKLTWSLDDYIWPKTILHSQFPQPHVQTFPLSTFCWHTKHTLECVFCM